MKYEISAGGVVIKKNNASWFLLLLMDKNDNWTFPKGLIEENESPEKTAAREITEETGIKNIKLHKKITPIQYYYKFEGELIKKTVHYFLFEAFGEEAIYPQTEEGIKEVAWFELEKARQIVGYKKTNKKILEETIRIISK